MQQTLWVIWEVFSNFADGLFFLWMMHSHFPEAKFPWKRDIIYLLMEGAFWYICNNTLSIPFYILFSIGLLFELGYVLAMPKSQRLLKLLWMIIVKIVFVMLNFAVVLLSSTWMGMSKDAFMQPGGIRFVFMLAYMFAEGVIFFTLSKIKTFHSAMNSRHLVITLVICAGTFFLAGAQSEMIYLVFNNPPALYLAVCITFGIILFIFLLLILLERWSAETKKREETQRELQVLEMEKNHRQQVEQLSQTIQTWHHDYRNHLMVINAYLSAGEYEALKKYVNTMDPLSEIVHPVTLTGNTVVDAILSNKVSLARSKGIKTRISVMLPETFPISVSDLSSLLGNLWDNAIRAASETPEAYIDMDACLQREMWSLEMRNSSQGTYNKDLSSTKAEEGHGLGLRSIRKLVTDANGIYMIEPLSESFTVRIMLPLARKRREG